MFQPAPSDEKRKESAKTESNTTKIKVSFTETKVLYFKGTITFQSKYCILKKVLY